MADYQSMSIQLTNPPAWRSEQLAKCPVLYKLSVTLQISRGHRSVFVQDFNPIIYLIPTHDWAWNWTPVLSLSKQVP